MKLRIKGNSIRLRLLRGEVAEFGAAGILRETIDFGAASLNYILQTSAETEKISAIFSDGKIVVSLPPAMAREWTEMDLISLHGEQPINGGEVLKILVEKDFICLDRPNDEDNRDAYPNLSHKC